MAEIRNIWQNMNRTAFLVCLATSVFLLVVSLFLPPKGAIDPSVIAGIGEMLMFGALAAVFEGIEKGKRVTFQRGDSQITVSKNHADGGDYENEINGEREN